MAGGLAALLDDIAALAKLAAASVDDIGAAAGRASGKAAGVVVDDTAVTPRYVSGIAAERELPIIKRIALGSLRNKLLIIVPAALLMSQFIPWLLTPLLMLGGTYLCFEGAEKIYETLSGHHQADETPAVLKGPEQEKDVVRGAVRTDFILSTEIMVIALNEVTSEPLLSRAIILVIVALVITLMVYGIVGLIVKMDDIGLHLSERDSEGWQRVGRALVKAMPILLQWLSTVGVFAMLWVGGHILLVGTNDLGWHGLYSLVHQMEEAVHAVPGVGGTLAWFTNTLASAILGLVVGAVVVLGAHLLPGRGGSSHDATAAENESDLHS